jgi:SOS-response transcriptional repressor LexA
METAPFHAPHSQKQSLDEWILDDPQASFLMKMEGDSMIEHGIHHGDMLVIQRASEARMNDLVIVVDEDAWSVRPYSEVSGSSEPLTVQAVVKALVRKYE